MSRAVRIGDRPLGIGAHCYIVAEAGVNHNGDPELAGRLVRAAAEAGADCVKFQLFSAEAIASGSAPKARYQLATTDPAESQVAMLRGLELPLEAYPELVRAAAAAGIDFLCTCYAEDELDYLDELGVQAFKFASAQIVELTLLAHAATKGKPLLLSTGMATTNEIAEALAAVRRAGDPPVVLLQCTTDYPSDPAEANLRAIPVLERSFGVPVGYSDHTPDDTAAVVAVALGAAVLEKHFTLDRTLPGPDQSSSLDPGGFAAMTARVRAAEAALGSPEKTPTPRELENREGMRRSLFAAVDIPAGTVVAREHVALKRPAVGLHPRELEAVLGSVARVDISRDSPIVAGMLERR